MKQFAALYWRLDSTTKTLEKVAALRDYLSVAPPADAMWAIQFLVGRRIKRLVGTRLLREWAAEVAGISPWLFEESYDRVGDLSETISLVLPPAETNADIPLAKMVVDHLLPLRTMTPETQRDKVLQLWSMFDQQSLFVLGKLMMGGFRVGVSQKLVVRAIAEQFEIDPATIAHRLMGDWEPTVDFYRQLIDPNECETAISKPYPFFLANPAKDGPEVLGDASEFVAEWKWDGVRAQLIRRRGETFIWSRGEDLVTQQFPEVADAAAELPDGTVIDGEIVAWSEQENRPMEFSQLQRRLGRKKVGKKLLTEVPVVMLAFDLIEDGGADIRQTPLESRQERLAGIVRAFSPTELASHCDSEDLDHSPTTAIRIPPPVIAASPPGEGVTTGGVTTVPMDWAALAKVREEAREFRSEGLMLKRKGSPYQVGRPVGDWWKWKVDPYTIDAVLIYAQRGHGRRANLYSDYTFALWRDDQLVPFAKAYSGLTDAEMRKVDAFVRKNTKEKFGPVRSVTPELVFELAFENIQKSKRHKSGIAVRFPRISRWRHDKKPADADRLETILAMIE